MKREGTIHIIPTSGGGTGAEAIFEAEFAPYAETMAAQGGRRCVGEEDLRSFLLSLGIASEDVNSAMRELREERTANIPNVSMPAHGW